MRYDRVGTDDCVITDCDTLGYSRLRADPDVVSDCDGSCREARLGRDKAGAKAMVLISDRYMFCNQAIRAYCDSVPGTDDAILPYIAARADVKAAVLRGHIGKPVNRHPILESYTPAIGRAQAHLQLDGDAAMRLTAQLRKGDPACGSRPQAAGAIEKCMQHSQGSSTVAAVGEV